MDTNQSLEIQEIERVLSNYALGELYEFERKERGYINTSYSITTRINETMKDFFLRRYRPDIQQEEIVFEHSVINQVRRKGFSLVAEAINTRAGQSFCIQYEDGDQNRPIYYAIFEYLPGVDKYTWDDQDCTPLEIKNAASVLAQFHLAVVGFQPDGRRTEPGIFDMVSKITDNLLGSLKKSKGTEFDRFLQKNSGLVLDSCRSSQNYLSTLDMSRCPKIVIHCDFHPGNLKFNGEQVVGLFDFDWSKFDYRCFDLALAIWYFSTSWKDNNDGILNPEKGKEFLSSYRSTLNAAPEVIPISTAEWMYLPMMVNLANLYILNWTISDFYAKDVEPVEYLVYLRHGINFLRWFSDSGQNILKDSF
jgi:homoserine kinase type II